MRAAMHWVWQYFPEDVRPDVIVSICFNKVLYSHRYDDALLAGDPHVRVQQSFSAWWRNVLMQFSWAQKMQMEVEILPLGQHEIINLDMFRQEIILTVDMIDLIDLEIRREGNELILQHPHLPAHIVKSAVLSTKKKITRMQDCGETMDGQQFGYTLSQHCFVNLRREMLSIRFVDGKQFVCLYPTHLQNSGQAHYTRTDLATPVPSRGAPLNERATRPPLLGPVPAPTRPRLFEGEDAIRSSNEATMRRAFSKKRNQGAIKAFENEY